MSFFLTGKFMSWVMVLSFADVSFCHLSSQLPFAGQGRQCSHFHPQAGNPSWCFEVLHTWPRANKFGAEWQISARRGSSMDGRQIYHFYLQVAGKGLLNRTPSVAFDCLEGTLASRPTGWKARVGGTQLSGISPKSQQTWVRAWWHEKKKADTWVSLRPVNLVLFRDCSNVFTAKFWPVSSVQHATHDDSH